MKLRRLATTSILGITLLGLLLPLRGVVADIVTTNIYLVAEDQVEDEDAYVASTSARVAGIINGDLVISTGSLTISGTVTGDVFVLSHGTVHVTGEVGGSLRGMARRVIVEGSIGDDVTVAAVTTRLSGTVVRDALVFGGSLTVDGEVKRNVNGRIVSALIDGKVGNDIDIAVGNLTLGQATVVEGDVLYRSGSDADIAQTARVASQLERLPTRGSFSVELALTLATILGFFGFLFAGMVLLWLFRATAPRAVSTIEERPLRAAAVGVGAIIVLPILVVVLAMTLVGVPVAVALLVLLALALVFAPVPAVTALGSRLLRGRNWGLFAAFVVGALIWRLGIWLIPLVGFALYLGALAAGLGGWLIAMREQRAQQMPEQGLLPAAPLDTGELPSPIGWDAPLAPGTRRASEDRGQQQEPGGDG
jgi:hypothetical protein